MIDTHQHFWSLKRGGYNWMPKDNGTLYRDYEPRDLLPLLQRAGISGTVAVQADDDPNETRYLLKLASEYPWILGVVGWVDLEAPTASEHIREFSEDPKFIGLRPMLQDLADDEWILRPSIEPAIGAMIELDLTFDALILTKHMGHLDTFMQRFPGLKVVINHCAKPDFKANSFAEWASQMNTLAAHPNCFCKLSGLLTELPSDGNFCDTKPYIITVLTAFGKERIVFGSDWPVLNLASDYASWLALVLEILNKEDPNAIEPILRRNAVSAYSRLQINCK